MPITNIFATWSLGGEEALEDTHAPGVRGNLVQNVASTTFVKQREHSGIQSSLFQSSMGETNPEMPSASKAPPCKVQKIAHSYSKELIEPLALPAAVAAAVSSKRGHGSSKSQSKSQPPPVPQHISVIISQPNPSSSSAAWQHQGQDFGSLSGDEEDDDLSQSSKSEDGIKSRELLPAPFFGYRDHSTEVDEDPLLPLTPFSKIPNFPAKLMAILSRPDFADIVCWMPHGRSWRVLKPREFEIRVLPSYFEHQKLSSFIRQANGWGFHRISQGLDRNSYYHELFLRGLPHLCKKMKRPRVNKKPVVDPDHEPDFYAISELHPLPGLHKEKASMHDDILLPSTLIGGPKARMQLHVDKDELRAAVSRALSGSMVPPTTSSASVAASKKPAAVGIATGLPSTSSFLQMASVQKASDTSLAMNATTAATTTTSSWAPPSLVLPPPVHSLLSSSYDPSAALSLLNPAMQSSGLGLGTSTSTTAPTLDPLSNLLFLLKQNQQQQAMPTWDVSSGNNALLSNPAQTSALLRLLNTSVPQASPDAAFAAGFAAATALHQRTIHQGSSNPPVDPTRSLELDAATAMFLLDNNSKKKTS